ncbi:cell adhesion molecule DSCAML1 isoform X2 [Periplaneta americana]|uniref:cell adhesion molecule DSCAML1 isoform X2 n=1 Tax=Periplaneta americana TaxID=6978 RepID=UPI0037E73EB4
MVIKKIIDIFLLIVIAEGCCYATEYPELQELTVDAGSNLTLPCTDPSTMLPLDSPYSVIWVREGRDDAFNRRRIEADGGLTLTALERDDAGIYTCTVEGEHGSSDDDSEVVRTRVKVEVRTPPPALANVTVHPSTVLALLLWEVADTGGYPITYFTARYRQKHTDADKKPDDWHAVMPEHISPNVRQIDVYRLDPNTTYVFKIWATNRLGAGEVTALEATTLHDTEEIELARHLLEGAQTFDTRVWVAAVAVVMGTLLMLAIGTCYLLYKDCHIPSTYVEKGDECQVKPIHMPAAIIDQAICSDDKQQAVIIV